MVSLFQYQAAFSAFNRFMGEYRAGEAAAYDKVII
jgi:hypothetical protein